MQIRYCRFDAFRWELRIYVYFAGMIDLSHAENQILCVTSFDALVSTPFSGMVNAICWARKLKGDFSEIVNKISLNGNITTVGQEELNSLHLTEQGQLARQIILEDLDALEAHGASPILNVISYYDRDETYPFFPTDVYSFHVDRSTVATDTFLCTYYGAPSEILPNSKGQQKIHIPEIRTELKKLYEGPEEEFEEFLSEHFFDLHYQPKPGAKIVNLGNNHLWRLAVDHPEMKVPPCLHRAPIEKPGQKRLLLIC